VTERTVFNAVFIPSLMKSLSSTIKTRIIAFAAAVLEVRSIYEWVLDAAIACTIMKSGTELSQLPHNKLALSAAENICVETASPL